MKVVFTAAGAKSLERLSARRQRQVLSRIAKLGEDPASRTLDVRPLEGGTGLFRLRVGDYRVLFTIDRMEGVVSIELVRARGDVYKR